MNELPEYFWADRLTPVNFYGYTSATRGVIYEIDVYKDRFTKKSEIDRFNDLKIKCLLMCVDMRRDVEDEPKWSKEIWDNKIVIECRTETGETIYVGYYDGTFSIGREVYSRDGRKPRPYREVVHPKELSES